MLPNIISFHDRYKIIFKYVVSKKFWSANINNFELPANKEVTFDKRFIFTD